MNAKPGGVLQRKCDMYWPAGGAGSAAEFGGVRVTLLHEDVRAAYTVRHMRVVPLPRAVSSRPAPGGHLCGGREIGIGGLIVSQNHSKRIGFN